MCDNARCEVFPGQHPKQNGSCGEYTFERSVVTCGEWVGVFNCLCLLLRLLDSLIFCLDTSTNFSPPEKFFERRATRQASFIAAIAGSHYDDSTAWAPGSFFCFLCLHTFNFSQSVVYTVILRFFRQITLYLIVFFCWYLGSTSAVLTFFTLFHSLGNFSLYHSRRVSKELLCYEAVFNFMLTDNFLISILLLQSD